MSCLNHIAAATTSRRKCFTMGSQGSESSHMMRNSIERTTDG